MTLSDWNLVTRLPRDRSPNPPGDHPRIFVSLDTHSLYLDQTARPAAQFSPADFSGNSCGLYETTAEYAAKAAADEKGKDADDRIVLIKTIAGAGASTLGSIVVGGSILFAIPGALIGVAAAWAELVLRNGWNNPANLHDPLPTAPAQIDRPAGPGQIGTVIHSVGLAPTDAPADKRQVWPRFRRIPPTAPPDETKLNTVVDGRAYSLWVATAEQPDSRPIWLPSETPTTPSFRGRWGNRVVDDPFNRRAGMRFPDFLFMFLDAIGR
jgi:hypothetical protein